METGKNGTKRVQKGGNVGTHAEMTVQKVVKKVAPLAHEPCKRVQKRCKKGAKRWRPWGTHRAKRRQKGGKKEAIRGVDGAVNDPFCIPYGITNSK